MAKIGTSIIVIGTFAAGISQLTTESFAVYLKYQAMVDTYYYRELAK